MRRRLPLLRVVLLLCLVLLVAIAGLLWFGRMNRVVVARGELRGGSLAHWSPRAGRVAEVLVAAGDRVEPGQVLIRLETVHLESEQERMQVRLHSLDDRLATLQEERERLRDQVHPAVQGQLRRDLERARLKLAAAEAFLQKVRLLHDKALATQVELEEAELAHKLAEVALTDATASLSQLASQQQAELDTVAAEQRVVAAELAEEQADLDELEHALGQSTVIAGQGGIVIGDELDQLAGRTVAQGDELLRLAGGAPDHFAGALSDSGRRRVRPGLAARIRLDGYPWLIHGTVAGQVELVAERRSDNGGFTVKIVLDPDTAPGPLFEGMAGQGRIIIEEKVALWRLLVEKLTGRPLS
jgi:multidrug resistance efflux pump